METGYRPINQKRDGRAGWNTRETYISARTMFWRVWKERNKWYRLKLHIHHPLVALVLQTPVCSSTRLPWKLSPPNCPLLPAREWNNGKSLFEIRDAKFEEYFKHVCRWRDHIELLNKDLVAAELIRLLYVHSNWARVDKVQSVSLLSGAEHNGVFRHFN